jgi:hypothetical protein
MLETATPFLWVPGNGPDAAALARLAEAFPKPKKPMGEAWFMAAEREMYPELLGDLNSLTDDELEQPLCEIATGPPSFGQLEEWTEWYHYLLPRLLLRPWRAVIDHPVEVLVTGFMSQHPDSAGDWPYPRFLSDALATLGQYIMSPHLWPSDELAVPRCFNKWRGPTGISGWFEAEGLFSASLFFCMKYLRRELVASWFESVIAIPNKFWRAQIITWLTGAHAILSDEIGQPGDFPENGTYSVGWEWSHVLKGNYSGSFDPPIPSTPFLPAENRMTILEIARSMETAQFFEELLTDPELDDVSSETAELKERFEILYGSGPLH